MKQEWLYNHHEPKQRNGSAMKNLYMVYDTVSCTVIGGIVQEMSDGPAIRTFTDALATKESILSQHPEDYNLLLLGTIADTGHITAFDDPALIFKGSTWKEMKNA